MAETEKITDSNNGK